MFSTRRMAAAETVMTKYEIHEVPGGVPIKAWTEGVPVEDSARRQLENVARMPFVHGHVAAMPDVHWGIGATVGSVIPCKGAIIPAAVGVDIGCGMMAVETNITANRLPDNLAAIRSAIERTVPHGFHKAGGWRGSVPPRVAHRFSDSGLGDRLKTLESKHPAIRKANSLVHLGTLGSGNHFIELCP